MEKILPLDQRADTGKIFSEDQSTTSFGRIERQSFLSANAIPITLSICIAALMLFARSVHPNFGPFDIESLGLVALPLALAALAQAWVVISGGIDLSIGSLIAVANVLAARLMEEAAVPEAIGIAMLILFVLALLGALNGAIIAVTRVPDVMVTLTTGFIFGGVALLILGQPGGGAPAELIRMTVGGILNGWIPNTLLVLLACIIVFWAPIRFSRFGLMIYAAGSDPICAFRSGISVIQAKIAGYAMGGLFAGLAGISLTLTTGIGSPLGGTFYTLTSIAAIVLGGVSLSGGQGGLFGPVLASIVLSFIPMLLIFMSIDPNFGQVIQGALLIIVVMIGAVLSKREARL